MGEAAFDSWTNGNPMPVIGVVMFIALILWGAFSAFRR